MSPIRRLVTPALLAALCLPPGGATAAGLEPLSPDLVLIAPAPAPKRPALEFSLGGSVALQPDYFGASSYGPVPELALNFKYLRLRNGREFGSQDPDHIATGFGLRSSFRYIRDRDSDRNPELTGLNDIDTAIELGLGLGYKQRNFEAFADVRYGVIGHNAFVGVLGADLVLRPTARLTLTAGPRLLLGSDKYAMTYFGVTPAESAASGLAAFDAEGGVMSAGLKIGAQYALTDKWGIDGALTYDRLLNDAADTPITGMGSPDQFKLRIGVTRRIRLEF